MLKQCKTANTPGCTRTHAPLHAIKCTLTYTSMDAPTDMPRLSPIICPHPRTIPHADGHPSTHALSQPWFILAHAMPITSCIHIAPSVLACIQPSMPLAHVPMPMSCCLLKQDGCKYTTHACSTRTLCIHITHRVPALLHASCVPLSATPMRHALSHPTAHPHAQA